MYTCIRCIVVLLINNQLININDPFFLLRIIGNGIEIKTQSAHWNGIQKHINMELNAFNLLLALIQRLGELIRAEHHNGGVTVSAFYLVPYDITGLHRRDIQTQI